MQSEVHLKLLVLPGLPVLQGTVGEVGMSQCNLLFGSEVEIVLASCREKNKILESLGQSVDGFVALRGNNLRYIGSQFLLSD